MPIINISYYDIDSSCLKYGLHHSLIDGSKCIKQDLGGAECQLLVSSVDKFVSPEIKDKFCQLYGKTTQALTNNVCGTKSDTSFKLNTQS